jgi:hypothetical protein
MIRASAPPMAVNPRTIQVAKPAGAPGHENRNAHENVDRTHVHRGSPRRSAQRPDRPAVTSPTPRTGFRPTSRGSWRLAGPLARAVSAVRAKPCCWPGHGPASARPFPHLRAAPQRTRAATPRGIHGYLPKGNPNLNRVLLGFSCSGKADGRRLWGSRPRS